MSYTFKKITVIVAIIILCLMLFFTGIMISRSKSNKTWPPTISECPDYFKVVGIDRCENTKNLGTCHGVSDFSAAEWQGATGLENKKKWAKDCGVVWDGITN
jgi:hypothetical protein